MITRRHVHKELFEQTKQSMEKKSFQENMVECMWKMEGIISEAKQRHCLSRAKYRGLMSLLDKKIAFKSSQENIDTCTSGGKLIFHIFSVLAEFERDLIQERAQAGLKAARARGKMGRRPPCLI